MLLELLLAAAQASGAPPIPPALRPWTTRSHRHVDSLVHVTIFDPDAGRHLSFAVFDEPSDLGPRIVRGSGGNPRPPAVQLTLTQCPSLRANLEALGRIPVPPLFLEGVSARPSLAAPNRISYRIEGIAHYPAGQGGLLILEERGSNGATPGTIAAWSNQLASDFERCVQRVLAEQGAGQWSRWWSPPRSPPGPTRPGSFARRT